MTQMRQNLHLTTPNLMNRGSYRDKKVPAEFMTD